MPPLFVDGVEINSVFVDGVEQDSVWVDGVQVYSGVPPVDVAYQMTVGDLYFQQPILWGFSSNVADSNLNPNNQAGIVVFDFAVNNSNVVTYAFVSNAQIPGVTSVQFDFPEGGITGVANWQGTSYQSAASFLSLWNYLSANDGNTIPCSITNL